MAIFSAIATAVSGFFAGITASAIGAFALKTVASIGLSALAQKLAGKKSTQADFSVKGQLGRGADIPQAAILGIFATAGTLTYSNTSDDTSPNNRMNWVITLSDIPVKALHAVWVNGKKVTLVSDGTWLHATEFNRGPGKYLGFRFYDGTQTTADAIMTSEVSTPERPWDATAIGRGRAYVVVRASLHPDLFANGFPTFMFEVQGAPLYNPALDSTMDTGAGSQRWNDPATWQPSNNPAVQLYNVLRGMRYGGQWIYGLQDVAAAQLPAAHWIAQIRKCATNVTGASGPEPQFRSSGEIPVGSEIVGCIESLLTACNGRLSDAGGVYKLFAGAPEAPVMSFTDADILSTENQTFTPFFGLADTVNGVSGKYPSPAAGWQVETAPPLYRDDLEAEDGGRRLLVDVSFDLVPYAEQVQRLMKASLNEARRARRHTITMPPEFWPLEPGDIVAWTSLRNGYIGKQFRVDGVIDLPNADVVLDLTEVDPADYDFNTAVDFTVPSIPGASSQTITAQSVGGFAVTAANIPDASGIPRRPAIKVVWTPVPDVASIAFEIRVKLTGRMLAPQQTNLISLGEMYISDGILSVTEYEVRARFIPDGVRPTEWTTWRDVTTSDIRLGVADLADDVAGTFTPDTIPPLVPTSLSATTSIVADGRGQLVATWTAPPDTDLAGYEVRVRIGGANYVSLAAYGPRFEAAILPGQTYSLQVRAFDRSGNRSGYTSLASGTAVADTTPPAVPTGLTVAAGYQLLWLTWNANSEADFHHYEIREQSAATPAPAAGTAASFSASGDQLARSGLPDSVTRHYWIRAVDTSGNKSAWSGRVQGTTSATPGVNTAALAGLVDATSFASGIRPVEVLAALPPAPHSAGRQVFLTTDKKLYRNTGTGWTNEVDGGDLRSNSVTTGAVAAGAINTAQLAAGAATIEKLAIGDFSNMIPNGGFERDADGWSTTGSQSVVTLSDATAPGPTALQVTANSNRNEAFWGPGSNMLVNTGFGMKGGDKYYCGMWVYRAAANTTGDLAPRMRVANGFDTTYGHLTFFVANASNSPAGVWTWFEGVVTVPSETNARKTTRGTLAVGLNPAATNGFFQITGVVLRRMASGELIVDGSLQARHITTGEFITSEAQIGDAIITDAKIANLDAGKITAGIMSAAHLSVDELLTIEGNAGLRHGKASVHDDATDGIYMGVAPDGFGFAASRAASGKRQAVSISKNTGFKLLNATHYVSGSTLPVAIQVEANLSKRSLPAGIKRISLNLIGGGGGGAGIVITDPERRDHTKEYISGSNGGATVVRLWDGATLKHTFTANGGAAGVGFGSSSSGNGGDRFQNKTELDYFGSGGIGGYRGLTYGSGDNQQRNRYTSKRGVNAKMLATPVVDVSGWANPQIDIVIGQGGGAGTDNNPSSFYRPTAGNAGKAQYFWSDDTDLKADVVPLIPTATGTFLTSASPGDFPDLGAGFWSINSNSVALAMSGITISPGVTIYAWENRQASFFSSQTPSYGAGSEVKTIRYAFHAMGDWG